LTLLRQYFSLKNKDQPRKFKHPLGEEALEDVGKPSQKYDEL